MPCQRFILGPPSRQANAVRCCRIRLCRKGLSFGSPNKCTPFPKAGPNGTITGQEVGTPFDGENKEKTKGTRIISRKTDSSLFTRCFLAVLALPSRRPGRLPVVARRRRLGACERTPSQRFGLVGCRPVLCLHFRLAAFHGELPVTPLRGFRAPLTPLLPFAS